MHRKPKSGRTPKTTERQQRALVRLVKADPTKTTIDVWKHASDVFGVEICNQTARAILNRHKMFARRPARKPLLKKCHRRAQLHFARAHQHRSVADWRRVIWSDESKFNLFTSDCTTTIRRPPGKRFDNKYIKGTQKFGGGGSVLVWGR